MKKVGLSLLFMIVLLSGCATGREEIVRTYYPDGQIHQERTYLVRSDGRRELHGPSIDYKEAGVYLSGIQTNYAHGKAMERLKIMTTCAFPFEALEQPRGADPSPDAKDH